MPICTTMANIGMLLFLLAFFDDIRFSVVSVAASFLYYILSTAYHIYLLKSVGTGD